MLEFGMLKMILCLLCAGGLPMHGMLKHGTVKNVKQEPKEMIESWNEIITDMTKYNPSIVGAFDAYRQAIQSRLLSFSKFVMPDRVSWEASTNDLLDNIAGLNILQQQSLKFSIQRNVNSSCAALHAVFDAKAALANYEAVLVRELVELLPHLLILMQEDELVQMHRINLNRLERGLKSVKARADKAIGLSSEADLANAKAEYESGYADMVAMQEQIKQAKDVFLTKVGRMPYKGLQKLAKVTTKDAELQNAPAVKAAFNAYKVARIRDVLNKVSLFTPSVIGEITKDTKNSNSPATVRVGLVIDFYNADSVASNIKTSGDANASMATYKREFNNMKFAQTTYESESKSRKAQVESLKISTHAADRYAMAEQRKFENAFQDSRDTSIINSDSMLRAFRQAHDRKLRLLDVERRFMENHLKHIIQFGMLWKIKDHKFLVDA